MIWKIRRNIVSFDRAILMGVLNITPDSFSDGGHFLDPQAAYARALQMIQEGADILDLGAESTRPGAEPVKAKDELERLLPVVTLLQKEKRVPISIDTTKPEVAKKCLEAGADIINDVSGLKRSGVEMAKVVQRFGAGLVLMHSRGTPETMHALTNYKDMIAEILEELRESVEIAAKAGVEHGQILIDPGLGFSKTAEQNLEILRSLKAFQGLGFPVMLGPSRKSFLGYVTGREVGEREFGTAACVALAVEQGVQILRVHEVKAMRDVIRTTEAIKKIKPVA